MKSNAETTQSAITKSESTRLKLGSTGLWRDERAGGAGVGDLLMLLNAWADVCTSQCCPADVNADGVVDVFDLLELLRL